MSFNVEIMKRFINRIRRAFDIHNIMLCFHRCNYDIKLYDIEMENNTNWLVTQCACGKTNINRVHRESVTYMEWNK